MSSTSDDFLNAESEYEHIIYFLRNVHIVYPEIFDFVGGCFHYLTPTGVQAKAVMFQHNHRKPISCPAMAQLLSNTLYYKRFFPYYTFNLCAGLDAQGKGAVYSYDAIGSYERCGFSCQGSGMH